MFLSMSAGSSLRRFGQSIKRIVREVEQQESGDDDDDDDGAQAVKECLRNSLCCL